MYLHETFLKTKNGTYSCKRPNIQLQKNTIEHKETEYLYLEDR